MEKDMVYLVWKSPFSHKQYRVAELYKKNNKFYFRYIIENVKEAEKDGFVLLISFPTVNATYENPQLFAAFSSRLPEETRPEIKEILATYEMNEYDEFELLKRSGAKLPIDNYEFIK